MIGRWIMGSLAMLVACARSDTNDAAAEFGPATAGSPTAIDAPLQLPPAMREREWISIQRTGCYGPCPQFTLTATATGTTEWIGKQDVHRLGVAYRVVDPGAVAQVYKAFADLDWLDLPQSGAGTEEGCSTDAPTTIVTLGRGLVARTLHDYHGCRDESRTHVRALEQRLIDLLAAPDWIERGAASPPSPDPTCRVAAFRPVFIARTSAPWTSLTDAAVSAISVALHEGGQTSVVRLVAIDNGQAELGPRVDALRISLQAHAYAYEPIDARVVPAVPSGPAPGEIRVLVTPEGCPPDDPDLADAR